MISINKGKIKMEGKISEIETDISVIINNLHRILSAKVGKEESKKMIMEAVKDGFKTDEEIISDIRSILKDLMEGLGE